MSLYYEVVFAVDLRDDTPATAMDELRWDLGLTADRPATLPNAALGPLLAPSETSYLPGGEIVRLERYLKYNLPTGGHYVHGLFTRLYWLDDQFADCWQRVVEFLWPHIESDGYAGFFREMGEVTPSVLVFRKGHGYLLQTNGVPEPLRKESPDWVSFDRRGRPE